MDTSDTAASLLATRSIPQVRHRRATVEGLSIFYREAGSPTQPTIVLLHGFPTSSHMFRELIPRLAEDFHLIAPDFPGFGESDMPARGEFAYTFDALADVTDKLLAQLGVERFSLYLMDYGAPVGFRLATRHPDRVETLLIQNGNAYEEGLREFWDPIKAYWASGADAERDALRAFVKRDATMWQYTAGTRNPEAISPDNWNIDQAKLDRPGNDEIQLDLFYDYRTNVPLYPAWQAYLREHQPPTLITWGRNDPIFPDDGAYPYLRDLRDVEFHLLNTGHFALEEDGELIAELIRRFVNARV